MRLQCAQVVLRDFGDVVMAYGQSDEYSFVLRPDATVYSRRSDKISTTVAALFASSFVFHWSEHFPDKPLRYPPTFDARCVCYPSELVCACVPPCHPLCHPEVVLTITLLIGLLTGRTSRTTCGGGRWTATSTTCSTQRSGRWSRVSGTGLCGSLRRTLTLALLSFLLSGRPDVRGRREGAQWDCVGGQARHSFQSVRHQLQQRASDVSSGVAVHSHLPQVTRASGC